MTDWTDLPEDVLGSIARRIPLITDFIRFGAVCSSCRSVAATNRQHLLHQFPWLLLPADNTVCSMKRRVYTLSDSRVANFHLPVPHNKRCVGSIGGWLVTVDSRLDIKIFNPFSGGEIPLPRLCLLSKLDPIELLSKVVLSSPPTSAVDRNFIAAAICGQMLAFWKPGEETWNPLDCDVENIEDIIYHKEQFYAVDNFGKVLVCDLASPIPDATEFAPRPNPVPIVRTRYLVESSEGDLLQVERSIVVGEKTDYETIGFEVFKLCSNDGPRWSRITDLNSEILFLGHNASFSLSACHFPSLKGNCIYFTDDYYRDPYYYSSDHFLGAIDMGIFDMEKQTVRPHYVRNAGEVFCVPPIWITPVLH
ncbi:F-box protein SKIP23-like [Aristolochia californica]|uniref:F-box protein SKIP23-like n=1 Tax=Aristolochia californica TaxID=171875 RepID=UPI0035D8D15C